MIFGDTILILPSYALKKMHLEELAGVKAKVVEVVRHADQIQGCWVRLPFSYLEQEEWYIPYNSIGGL